TLPYCNKCGMEMRPSDSFCSRCGAKACFTPTPVYTPPAAPPMQSFPNNPYGAPRFCKACPKCHSYINAVLRRCPNCNFVFVTPR
ncbi:MAG: zinc-ribbon domain-containing protein, partial [Lachnospiraceae bacterium]|nr:zinc-ribbon domain-containing protein [Lachnospiraceae bacterium]